MSTHGVGFLPPHEVGEARVSTPGTAILSRRARATIAAAARIMYPHDALPDDVYARVSETLAEAGRADPGTARTIREGVAALDDGQAFADLPPDEQLKILEGIQDSDFFELVRSTAVVEVYSDQRTWRLVGYEGPSFDKGGYVSRGFNDLDWLPDPEAPS
jgi:Gluconate 2-dehydrogenase subunit 3